MTRKQTSAKVSSHAGELVRLGHDGLRARMKELCFNDDDDPISLDVFVAGILALAASCLSQDEVKGSKFAAKFMASLPAALDAAMAAPYRKPKKVKA